MEDFLEDSIKDVFNYLSPKHFSDENEFENDYACARNIPDYKGTDSLAYTDVWINEEFKRFMWLHSKKRWKLASLVKPEDLDMEMIKIDDEVKKLEELSKKFFMSKNTPNSRVASESRLIVTTLMNKEEVFRMCALAEATGMCLLLVGPPGTGKTKVVIEYAKAMLKRNNSFLSDEEFANSFAEKLFILETDEGTKSSEVKGQPDLEELFLHNKFKLNAPITTAEIVILNEIDKAGSNVRNSLLGVMNEKFLFSGKTKIPCQWKLLIATCNSIPKDEASSPFWDRFPLKMEVSRIGVGEMSTYYSKGDKSYQDSFTVQVPNESDIASVTIPSSMMNKFLDIGHAVLSDRTLTFVPTFAKAISFIWNVSLEQALIKTAAIMIGATASQELASKLKSPEKKNLDTKIQTLYSMNTPEQIQSTLDDIEALIVGYQATKKLNIEDVEELRKDIDILLKTHPIKQKEAQLTEALNGISVDELPF